MNHMNSRERIHTISSRQAADRHGFWLGHPSEQTRLLVHDCFDTSTEGQLRLKLRDDFRRVRSEQFIPTSLHAQAKNVFDLGPKTSLGQPRAFAACQDISCCHG